VRHHITTRLRAVALAIWLPVALSLSSCGNTVEDGAGKATIENCGRQVDIDVPPERVVSINQGTTELLLALGLEDRIVGTATWTEPVRSDLSAANEKVPQLSDDTPSFEAVLDSEPDFVMALYYAMFTDERVAARDAFEELGVRTWLSPTSCFPEDETLSERVGLDDIYGEITAIARIFGVPERGRELVAELQQTVTAAQEKVNSLKLPRDFSAIFWFGQNEPPYLAGSTGAPQIIARTLGIENAYADVSQHWAEVAWDDVLNRSPDVIVACDLTREGEGQSLQSKIDFVNADAAISRLPAAQEDRWIAVRGTELNITISTIDGIEKVADALVNMYGEQ
jgi:iron complex transport system substrate-binding protein